MPHPLARTNGAGFRKKRLYCCQKPVTTLDVNTYPTLLHYRTGDWRLTLPLTSKSNVHRVGHEEKKFSLLSSLAPCSSLQRSFLSQMFPPPVFDVSKIVHLKLYSMGIGMPGRSRDGQAGMRVSYFPSHHWVALVLLRNVMRRGRVSSARSESNVYHSICYCANMLDFHSFNTQASSLSTLNRYPFGRGAPEVALPSTYEEDS